MSDDDRQVIVIVGKKCIDTKTNSVKKPQTPSMVVGSGCSIIHLIISDQSVYIVR